jgi:hypothetical protein
MSHRHLSADPQCFSRIRLIPGVYRGSFRLFDNSIYPPVVRKPILIQIASKSLAGVHVYSLLIFENKKARKNFPGLVWFIEELSSYIAGSII